MNMRKRRKPLSVLQLSEQLRCLAAREDAQAARRSTQKGTPDRSVSELAGRVYHFTKGYR